jgi:hypothetical protein
MRNCFARFVSQLANNVCRIPSAETNYPSLVRPMEEGNREKMWSTYFEERKDLSGDGSFTGHAVPAGLIHRKKR